VVWQDHRTTYAELDARVTGAARGLADRGVGRGDRVALLLGNTPAFVEAFLATLRLGATTVPLNPGLTAREVQHVLADSGAEVLVAARGAWSTVEGLSRDVLDLEHVIAADTSDAPLDAGGTWAELVEAGNAAVGDEGFVDPDRGPDDIAALVYTSGTTGRPKGAMLTRRNLAANQDQVLSTRLGVRDDDVLLGVLPLFHIYAMNVGLGTAVRAGATLVLVERFDPYATLEEIERHGVTIVLGAPPMYIAWLNTPGASEIDLSSVRIAVSGAAALPAAVLERSRDELGMTIWEGYGLTEAGPAVTTNAMGGEVRPGSVGLPLPGVEVRLVDDTGREVNPGDPGEVLVRGDNVFAGYWNDPEASARALTDDGWLRTGDVGIVDDEGYLHLVDRASDLIIVSGFNVYPREVEDALRDHPHIEAVAVVGEPHPYTGEAVRAYVVPSGDAELTGEDVLAWAETRLARFKCPETVRIVSELPYTATGKVRRSELRAGDAAVRGGAS
jgi:long-chain acyl-CoA synthetase